MPSGGLTWATTSPGRKRGEGKGSPGLTMKIVPLDTATAGEGCETWGKKARRETRTRITNQLAFMTHHPSASSSARKADDLSKASNPLVLFVHTPFVMVVKVLRHGQPDALR